LNFKKKNDRIELTKIMKGSVKMKRKIRNSVFETNSSSMHSLSYTKYKELKKSTLEIDEDGYIHVELGDYSDIKKDLVTQKEKLAFVISYMNEELYYGKNDYTYPTEEEFEKYEPYVKLKEMICDYTGCKGIVIDDYDPQIAAGESMSISGLPDTESLKKLIFGKEGKVVA
jgi:hypothetical protein